MFQHIMIPSAFGGKTLGLDRMGVISGRGMVSQDEQESWEHL